MIRLYLDTSIVVALFVEERQSPSIRSFLRTERKAILSSDFLRLEFASAVGLKVRAEKLSDPMARQAIFFCDQWMRASTQHIGLESCHIEAAWAMLNSGFDVNLRAPDALHLAIASKLGSIFVTHDKRLQKVAPDFGIRVVSP